MLAFYKIATPFHSHSIPPATCLYLLQLSIVQLHVAASDVPTLGRKTLLAGTAFQALLPAELKHLDAAYLARS